GGSLYERGLFQVDSQNRLHTLLIEGQTVDRARQLTVTSLADSLDQQSANGTVVTAVYLGQKTGWVLYRIRANAAGTDVIREPLLSVGRVRDVTGPDSGAGLRRRLFRPDPDDEYAGLCLRAVHQNTELPGSVNRRRSPSHPPAVGIQVILAFATGEYTRASS